MTAPVLKVRGVSKTFRTARRAPADESAFCLAPFDLTLNSGEVLALIGPNGSGKTTLLKILASLLLPDSGEVLVCGERAGSAVTRRLVGFFPGDDRSLYAKLSGIQNLRFFGGLHGLGGESLDQRIDELSELFGLRGFLDERVERCSNGMRARLGLARALLHRPRLLLLDEPTKSLDSDGQARVESLVGRADTAVVFATHGLEEASRLASSIGRLHRGTLTIERKPLRHATTSRAPVLQ